MKKMKALIHKPLFWVMIIIMCTITISSLLAQGYGYFSIKRDPNTQGLRQLVDDLRVELDLVKADVVKLKTDSALYRQNEIIRLTMLASESVGSVEMLDIMGKQDDWTQALVDSINADIEEHQLRLEAMGFERFDYIYTPAP